MTLSHRLTKARSDTSEAPPRQPELTTRPAHTRLAPPSVNEDRRGLGVFECGFALTLSYQSVLWPVCTVSGAPMWMSAHPNKRQTHTVHRHPAQRGGVCDGRATVRVSWRHRISAGGLGEAKIWQVAPGWTRRGPCQPPEREVKGASGRARLRARHFNAPLRSRFQ